jgi:hypothetical protein
MQTRKLGRRLALVDLLRDIAGRKHATPAQIPIEGARYPEALEKRTGL